MKYNYILPVVGIPHDYSKDYCSLVTKTSGTFTYANNTPENILKYSLNEGETWVTFENNVESPIIPKDKRILLKGTRALTLSEYSTINSTALFEVEGNIMSLLYEDDYQDKTDLSGTDHIFSNLFKNNTNVLNAENLILPATTLGNWCYSSMFNGATNLSGKAPELPAETLTSNCYNSMFRYSNIEEASELPATTLATTCYTYMYDSCPNLKKGPTVLPAKLLVDYCYYQMFCYDTALQNAPEILATSTAKLCCRFMFYGCTSLKNPPSKLLSEVVANQAYYGMFRSSGVIKTPEILAHTIDVLGCQSMFLDCTNLKVAYELPATTIAGASYYMMFSGCTNLTTIPKILPALTLGVQCYDEMFKGCTSITKTPELPATTLATQCYRSMFLGCTSLVEVCDLPATTLANNCYNIMFYNCTSLKKALDILPAMTATLYCYASMFSECHSLETPPLLPATTLAPFCYASMFFNCTSLLSAPELPAETLVDNCYYAMFYHDSLIDYIKALFTTTPSGSYTDAWVEGVSSTGTFFKNPNATWNVVGINGVPNNWTIITE